MSCGSGSSGFSSCLSFHQNQLPPAPASVRHFCDRALALDDIYKLLHYLDLAQNPKVGQAAAVDNFVARLLETLWYASGRRIIVTHQAIPLIIFICGTQCSARTDVCICDENDYLLLVQKNFTHDRSTTSMLHARSSF